MVDYTISETFTLPSKGLIYYPNINPEVTMRSMNTADEMRRLSVSEYQNKPMCDVLDNCIVNDTDISTYDMCLGDYQFLLYKLRVITYGADFEINTNCPFCKFPNKDTLNLDMLPIMEYDESIENYKTFTLPVTGKQVKIKFTTPRMLDNIDIRAKEMKQKSSDKKQDFSMLVALTSIIDTIDGKNYNIIDLEKWVHDLPMKDTNTILAYSTKLNNSLGVDTNIEEVCELCGLDYKVPFNPGYTFFRPEINI